MRFCISALAGAKRTPKPEMIHLSVTVGTSLHLHHTTRAEDFKSMHNDIHLLQLLQLQQ